MNIESHDLKTLRETTSRALLVLLWLHVPICLAIGMMRGGDWLFPVIFTTAMAVRQRYRGAPRAMSFQLA